MEGGLRVADDKLVVGRVVLPAPSHSEFRTALAGARQMRGNQDRRLRQLRHELEQTRGITLLRADIPFLERMASESPTVKLSAFRDREGQWHLTFEEVDQA